VESERLAERQPSRPSGGLFLRGAIASLVVLAVVLGIVAVASAHHSDIDDPNDTEGPLDIREVKLDHTDGTEFTIVTFAHWKPRGIWDHGAFFVLLDTFGDERADYYVLARSTGTRMEASLWRDRKGGRDRFVRKVSSRRKSPQSVSVSVPVKSLDFGKSRTSYFWWTNSTFTGEKCRHTCIDRAPDDGSIEQWRPGMKPGPPT
jgi:hypothetical protein